MVASWGLRLAWHIGRRVLATDEEDPRYAELLRGQAVLASRCAGLPDPGRRDLVRLAAGAGRGGAGDAGRRGSPGSASRLWLVGHGLRDGRRRPARGVQARTRTAAAGDGPRPVALHPAPQLLRRRLRLVGHLAGRGRRQLARRCSRSLSPVVMTYFLVFATGAKLLEQTMMKREGYPEYAARTSMFFPLPAEEAAGQLTRLGFAGLGGVGPAQVERVRLEELERRLSTTSAAPRPRGARGRCGVGEDARGRAARPAGRRRSVAASTGLSDLRARRPAAPGVRRDVDLLAAGVGGDHEVVQAGVHRLGREDVEGADAVDRDAADERQRARGDQPDPQAGERARARRRRRSR